MLMEPRWRSNGRIRDAIGQQKGMEKMKEGCCWFGQFNWIGNFILIPFQTVRLYNRSLIMERSMHKISIRLQRNEQCRFEAWCMISKWINTKRDNVENSKSILKDVHSQFFLWNWIKHHGPLSVCKLMVRNYWQKLENIYQGNWQKSDVSWDFEYQAAKSKFVHKLKETLIYKGSLSGLGPVRARILHRKLNMKENPFRQQRQETDTKLIAAGVVIVLMGNTCIVFQCWSCIGLNRHHFWRQTPLYLLWQYFSLSIGCASRFR